MRQSPVICTSLTKRFGNVIALESVSIDVDEPSVIGLVGPNGSGKTTLLRLLMGAIRPSSGEVRLYGRAPKEARLHQTDVGYLSAADRMYPELTVFENMIYRGRMYGLEPEHSASMAARLLRERNLYGLRDRRPDTLSTGQRRQVCLLSVLMHSPKILLLDEPTTGIDILAITQIYQLMAELCEDNCTIILATHHLEELTALCHRTIALYDGQLIHDGLTSALGSRQAEVRDALQYLFLGRRLPSPEDEAALSRSRSRRTTLPSMELTLEDEPAVTRRDDGVIDIETTRSNARLLP